MEISSYPDMETEENSFSSQGSIMFEEMTGEHMRSLSLEVK